ncbi:hypothetical protein [Streptomyces sp. NPDC050145]|uniref:hypothetical protein n=1 Tax=Streptomyces sp. NPDC050145 TaxID=3365602 RepID=UPI0037BBD49E
MAVDAPAGDVRSIKEQVRSATEKYAGRQAAIVLTFGRHPDPAGGGKYATEVNSALRTARPEMFGKATTRDFWKGGSAGGHADIEIYFYTYEN